MTEGDDRAERVARLAQLNQGFAELVPHNRALGLRMELLLERTAVMCLPFREDLVGDPETGVLHGGAISSLMDACCGAAVFMALEAPTPIATLDLRIDYLRPAVAGLDVFARAECIGITRTVGFVRASAYHVGHDAAVAAAAATFVIGTKVGPEPGWRKGAK